ncbi:MAG: lipopolysaccharide biosynthesis protein [Rikenellaceae bacterium]
MGDKHSSGRSRNGVVWSALERFGVQGSQFVVSVVLARLLVPADYGLIAMLSIFIALATSLVESGVAQTLIQRKERSGSDLTTALVFNVCVAVALYWVMFFAAPFIAQFYDAAELTKVVRWFSLVLIINSLSIVQQALIAIDLAFHRLAVASLCGIFVGGAVAIVMAYNGAGVWALVAHQLISGAVKMTILWAMSSWRPRDKFSFQALKDMASFSSNLMLSGVLHVLYNNIYTLIIGRRYAQAELGLFNYATTLSILPSHNLSAIVERALYPVMCEAQSDLQADRDAMSEILLRHLRLLCFFVFGAMVGLSVLAKPFIALLLGAAWSGVVPFLQIIAVAYMWDPIMKFLGSGLKAAGRSSDFLKAESLKKIVGFGILALSVPWGVLGMCYGMIAYAFADMAIITFYSRRVSPLLGYRNIFCNVAPLAALSIAMGYAIYRLRCAMECAEFSALEQVACGAVFGLIIYIGGALLLGRKEPREIFDLLKR